MRWNHLLFLALLALFQRSCSGYLLVTDNTITARRTRFHGPKHSPHSSTKITSGTTALHAGPMAIAPTLASALVVAGVIAFHEGIISNDNLISFCFALLTYSYVHVYSPFSLLLWLVAVHPLVSCPHSWSFLRCQISRNENPKFQHRLWPQTLFIQRFV